MLKNSVHGRQQGRSNTLKILHFRQLQLVLALRRFTELHVASMSLLRQKNIADGHKWSFVAVIFQLLYSFNSAYSPVSLLTWWKYFCSFQNVLITLNRTFLHPSTTSSLKNIYHVIIMSYIKWCAIIRVKLASITEF